MEQEKRLNEINYLKLAAAFLFLNAAGASCSGKRNGAARAKTVKAGIQDFEPLQKQVSEIAQEEVMAAHRCYEGN